MKFIKRLVLQALKVEVKYEKKKLTHFKKNFKRKQNIEYFLLTRKFSHLYQHFLVSYQRYLIIRIFSHFVFTSI